MIESYRPPPADWQAHAACKGTDPRVFTPDSNSRDAAAPAALVCGRCPVRIACLEEAMAAEGLLRPDHRAGVWGGLSVSERTDLALARSRAGALRREVPLPLCELCPRPVAAAGARLCQGCEDTARRHANKLTARRIRAERAAARAAS